MMVGGFRVDPGDLADTSARTDELSSRVRAAAAGARPIDPRAYGVAGQPFAGPALVAAGLISDALDDLALDTDRGADGLRGTRDGYLDTERAAVSAFDGLAR
ncbi:hypothetical protein [Pseudonocardia humida]|uniref:Excreted virulence factor EspC (Type VII ESX diderm) n=1 Tax=Pseudonocardia humida TaxID=2800819 RepID=A0ABT1A3U0_9PSEU|nr:hypothetical protein [Pseudonocardia humida]MCO1657469.1 hypothetical protein [Pseudonocardia humida]